MAYTLTKKARGYCPYLGRSHSISVEGTADISNSFKKEKMRCPYAEECNTGDGLCPIYQKV